MQQKNCYAKENNEIEFQHISWIYQIALLEIANFHDGSFLQAVNAIN